jgi:serine/threonine protein kinase
VDLREEEEMSAMLQRCTDVGAYCNSGVANAWPFSKLREITSGFRRSSLAGMGSFACVFKGELPGGQKIAVKILGARVRPPLLVTDAAREGGSDGATAAGATSGAGGAGGAGVSAAGTSDEDAAKNILIYSEGYRQRRNTATGEEEQQQFKTELEMVSRFRHDRIVSLLGYSLYCTRYTVLDILYSLYCTHYCRYSLDGPWRCLVFELMGGGTLQDALKQERKANSRSLARRRSSVAVEGADTMVGGAQLEGEGRSGVRGNREDEEGEERERVQWLDWRKRASIALDVARALAFLHDTGHARADLGAAVHRDVKSENGKFRAPLAMHT